MSGDGRVSSLLHSGGALDTQLSALIAAAALDPGKWQHVLDKLSVSIPGVRTQMFGYDVETKTDLGLLQHGYAPDAIEEYLNHYGALNVWVPGFFRHKAGATVPSQAMATRDVVVQSTFYNEWVRPQEDVTSGGAVMLFKEKNRMFVLGGNIPSRHAERLQPQLLAVLEKIAAQLQQTFEVNRALAGLSLEKYVAGHAANQVNAIVLLSPTGRLIYGNKVANDLMAAGTVMKLRFERKCHFVDPAVQMRLEAALHPLSRDVPQTFLVHAGDGTQLFTSRLLAIPPDALDYSPFGTLIGLNESAFILAMTPTNHQQGIEVLLNQHFGLTLAEARVANAISLGLSPRDIAERDAVSVHTVRSQVKAAMAKTDSNRQVQLAAKVMALRMSRPDR